MGEPAAQAGSSARTEIQALLDRRAEAIIARDKSAFMGTVAPGRPTFRARQARLFDGFADLDLAEYELRADWGRVGDLVRASDRRRYGNAPVSIPVTVERYGIAGMDPEVALEDFYYSFVRHDGEWRIANDTDLEDVGLYSARHLWDSGPIESRSTEHFTFFAHPCEGTCVDIADMGTQAEKALQRVRRYWDEVPSRTAVLVPSDAPELERMIQSTFELDNFVAFAYSSEDPDLGYTGNRVLLNPDAFRGIRSDYAFQILAHEMLHIATRRAAGPFVPIFVDEGFADYVGNDASESALEFFRADVAAGRFAGVVPQDFLFTTGTGDSIFRAYQDSLAAVDFFVDRWGLPRFRRFYERLGRLLVTAGTTRYWVDKTLKQTIGVDLHRFERLWADSIQSP